VREFASREHERVVVLPSQSGSGRGDELAASTTCDSAVSCAIQMILMMIMIITITITITITMRITIIMIKMITIKRTTTMI
jgi:hypothetical protein